MKANFLRRPHGPADYLADAVRLLGALSVLGAAVWFQPTDAGVVAFTLPALVAPRFLGMRAAPDIALQLVVLVAAWSNVFDLYRTIGVWDILVHFACTGVLTLAGYLFLARSGAVAAPRSRGATVLGTLVVAVILGLALSALWEMVEWAGWRFISGEIHVSYQDTIGDMAAGGTGALVAGIVLAGARLTRPDAT